MSAPKIIWIDDSIDRMEDVAQGCFVRLWDHFVRSEIILYGTHSINESHAAQKDVFERATFLSSEIATIMRNAYDDKKFKTKRHLICSEAIGKNQEVVKKNDFVFGVNAKSVTVDVNEVVKCVASRIKKNEKIAIMIDLILNEADYQTLMDYNSSTEDSTISVSPMMSHRIYEKINKKIKDKNTNVTVILFSSYQMLNLQKIENSWNEIYNAWQLKKSGLKFDSNEVVIPRKNIINWQSYPSNEDENRKLSRICAAIGVILNGEEDANG